MKITFDEQTIDCPEGMTIMEAADSVELYIPRICHHPDVPPTCEVVFNDSIYQVESKIIGETQEDKGKSEACCNLCLVTIDGQSEPVNSCKTKIENGMIINLNTNEVVQRRKQALSKILSDHPHSCLTCAQKEGCSRTDCSTNVPVNERCCRLLGHCELEKVAEFIGIPGDTPKYIPQAWPATKDDPLFDRDYNLCIGCLRCVRICNKVQVHEILGAVWKDNRSWVGTVTGTGLKEADCRFCTACVEVCPTGALLDKDNVPKIKTDSSVPCVGNCPAGIDIPGYTRAIAAGRYNQALEIIRNDVPFPGILGYVCFHPCEDACRRNEIDQPISICALKRFAADYVSADELSVVPKGDDTGKKVAIIGSGPAGLTAAYYLAVSGHQVDIFERESQLGGMLRYGIPDYRLPSEILERELMILKTLSVNFHLDYNFKKDTGVDKLKSEGFDAILIAAGVSSSKTLPIDGSDLEGIYLGLEFLKTAKINNEPKLNGDVIIIGGGNVAIDAAMTAVRLGAESVNLVCLESREEIPAHDWEIKQAEDEGVIINNSWGPERFMADGNKVSGVEFIKCTKVFDEQGRFNPQFDKSVTTQFSAKTVVITIGQQVDEDLVSTNNKGPGGTLKVDDNYYLGQEGLFAVGDVVRGPSSVIDAIADGRKVANIIDTYLSGNGISTGSIETGKLNGSTYQISSETFKQSRQMAESLEPQARKTSFSVIEETMSIEMAQAEAARCLRCNIRQSISPAILPPDKWLLLDNETVEKIREVDGVYQLLNDEKKVLSIKGTDNVKEALLECLEDPGNAKWFIWEEDQMYSKRESELLQQYLQEHGELPEGAGGDDDLDDLF